MRDLPQAASCSGARGRRRAATSSRCSPEAPRPRGFALAKRRVHRRDIVACALGWACWKTYCDSVFGHVALNLLATSMMKDERWEEGLLVHQAQLAKLRTEFPVNQEGVIDVLNNLKECYCWNFCGNHGTSSSTGVSMISRRRRVWRTITTVSTSTRPTPRVKPTRRTLQKYSRFCKTCKLQILLK